MRGQNDARRKRLVQGNADLRKSKRDFPTMKPVE